VLDTGDEVDLREEAAQSQDNGGADDSSKKADNFIVSLHGLPYSATLDDIANFLEGLNVYCGSGKCRFIFREVCMEYRLLKWQISHLCTCC